MKNLIDSLILVLVLIGIAVAVTFANDQSRKSTASFKKYNGKIQDIGKSLNDADKIVKSFNTEFKGRSMDRNATDIERAAIELKNADDDLENVKAAARYDFENQTGGIARPLLDVLSGNHSELDDFINVDEYTKAKQKLEQKQDAFDERY